MRKEFSGHRCLCDPNSNFIGCPTAPFLPIAACRHGIGYSRNAAILVLEIYDLLAS
jgi:hypothetical protein